MPPRSGSDWIARFERAHCLAWVLAQTPHGYPITIAKYLPATGKCAIPVVPLAAQSVVFYLPGSNIVVVVGTHSLHLATFFEVDDQRGYLTLKGDE